MYILSNRVRGLRRPVARSRAGGNVQRTFTGAFQRNSTFASAGV